MADINVAGIESADFDANLGGFREIVAGFHSDPGFRAKVENDPSAVFREHGIDLPSNVAVKVVANDAENLYVVFPPDPNGELSDELLESVAGGSTFGSVGSAATASSLVCACAPSSASTLSSAGTASSVDV